jgi:hypothetical protein
MSDDRERTTLDRLPAAEEKRRRDALSVAATADRTAPTESEDDIYHDDRSVT